MSLNSRLTGICAVLAAALGGYFSRALQQGAASTLPPGQVAGLEYFVQARSFSEAENLRAEIEGLAERFITEARVRRGFGTRTAMVQKGAEDDLAVSTLERGLDEFAGTNGELILLRDLLHVLRPQPGRWLDVYLAALYRHPTDDFVGSFASAALVAGQATGREREVGTAFRHVLDIPLEFPAKERVQALDTADSPVPGQLAAGRTARF